LMGVFRPHPFIVIPTERNDEKALVCFSTAPQLSHSGA
jgi:hypothetical protein